MRRCWGDAWLPLPEPKSWSSLSSMRWLLLSEGRRQGQWRQMWQEIMHQPLRPGRPLRQRQSSKTAAGSPPGCCRRRWTGCGPSGKQTVELVTHVGGSHEWPAPTAAFDTTNYVCDWLESVSTA